MIYEKYQLTLPYPSTENIKPDLRQCRLIEEDYAGSVSELSAIHLYIYNHFIAKKEGYSEIGEILEKIAITEMHHLDLLGNAIIKLGGDPKFCTHRNNRTNWWSGDKINYKKGIRNIIEENIRSERAAIRQYQHHADIIPQKAVVSLLERIILDEKYHIEILTKLLKHLDNNPHISF